MMIYLADQIARTVGVTWESSLTLILGFATSVCLAIGFAVRRFDRGRERTERFVTDSVNAISSTLGRRLDAVDAHLHQQDRDIADQGKRLARVEGFLFPGSRTD